MRIRAFKYLSPVLIYLGALQAFLLTGLVVWLPLMYTWIMVPLLELFIKPDPRNLSAAEEEMARANPVYDWLLYLIVPLQYGALFLFLQNATQPGLTPPDLAGRTLVMGLLCGTFGINVGHELGHRANRKEQFLAQMLLLTSLYLHFFIEHNRGHHKRVATPADPASARLNEPVYLFYLRSIAFSYTGAWHIANGDQRKKGNPAISLRNQMVQMQLVQLLFVALIGILFGWLPLLLFLVAAGVGILLLETVNYIEHYGLSRRPLATGGWEPPRPQHSWNSDHVIGRVMLFELSRHSDHHYRASRKYQLLRHHEAAPQMPTGYPGMMILSLVPPLWFRVMNKKVAALQNKAATNVH